MSLIRTPLQPVTLRRKTLVLAMQSALFAFALGAALPASHAQSASSSLVSQTRVFNIPAGKLDVALDQFARVAGINVAYDASLLSGLNTKGLNGNYQVSSALNELLLGSGLEAVSQAGGGFSLRKMAAPNVNNDAVLPAVMVRAMRDGGDDSVQGYVPKRTVAGTKTDTPILEIPQSISIIGRDEIEATGAQDVMDIVARTPGIAVNTYGPDNRGWEYISMRGFSGITGNYRDGLPQSYFGVIYRMTEPYALERLEVLRGPSSVMYGQGDAGGIINRVSKQANGERTREVALQYGSFDRKQLAFDLGDRIDEQGELSFRLVGVALDTNDQDRYPDGQKISRTRSYLAPSLRWQPNAGTSVTLLGEFLKDYSGEDPYYAIAADGSLTRVKMGDPSFSKFNQDQSSIGYKLEHVLNDEWTLRQNMRYSDIDMTRRVIWVDTLQPDGHTYSRVARSWDDKLEQTTVDTSLQGKIRTGQVEHTVLLGIDWNRYEGNALRFRGAAPDLDLLNPIYGMSIANPAIPLANFTQTTSQTGIYAQNQIKFSDRWILTLGGRQDRVKSTTDNRLNSTNTTQSDDAFSARAGLSYLIGNGWAPYVSYGESFLPSSGLDAAGNPFKPSRGKQVEMGIKFQPATSNSLFTAAIFDLQKTNVVGYDPVADEQRQIGKQRSRGIELEAKTELLKDLNLVASYTRLDAKVLQSADSSEVGKKPATVPEQTASLWLDYAMANGFGLGGGMDYVGRRQNDEANTSAEGVFTLLNVLVRYNYGAWRFTLNVTNLLDKQYNTICYHGECYLGRERAMTATARYRF